VKEEEEEELSGISTDLLLPRWEKSWWWFRL